MHNKKLIKRLSIITVIAIVILKLVFKVYLYYAIPMSVGSVVMFYFAIYALYSVKDQEN